MKTSFWLSLPPANTVSSRRLRIKRLMFMTSYHLMTLSATPSCQVIRYLHRGNLKVADTDQVLSLKARRNALLKVCLISIQQPSARLQYIFYRITVHSLVHTGDYCFSITFSLFLSIYTCYVIPQVVMKLLKS